jgi:hypothetical protein
MQDLHKSRSKKKKTRPAVSVNSINTATTTTTCQTSGGRICRALFIVDSIRQPILGEIYSDASFPQNKLQSSTKNKRVALSLQSRTNNSSSIKRDLNR